MEAMKGQRTIGELAGLYQVHPSRIAAGATKCFPGPAPSAKLLSMSAAEERAILSDRTMMFGASGHRRGAMALILCLLAALIALASGLVGPSSVSAKTPCTPQNRVWENSAGMLQSRPVQTPQSLELQRENSVGRYDSAAGDTLAAKGEPHLNLTDAKGQQHILEGGATGGGHGPGRGVPGKSEFPRSWSDGRVLNEVSDIATDPLKQQGFIIRRNQPLVMSSSGLPGAAQPQRCGREFSASRIRYRFP